MTARLRKEQGLTTEQPVFEQMPVQAGPLMEVSVSGDPVRKGKNDEPAVNLTTETNNPYSETLAEYRVGKPILACRLLKFSAKDQATVVNDLSAYEVEPCKITAEAFKQLPLEMQHFVQQHPTLYIIQ